MNISIETAQTASTDLTTIKAGSTIGDQSTSTNITATNQDNRSYSTTYNTT